MLIIKWACDTSFPLTLCFKFLLQACASAEEFMQHLPQFDNEMARARQEAEDAGDVSISRDFCLFLFTFQQNSFDCQIIKSQIHRNLCGCVNKEYNTLFSYIYVNIHANKLNSFSRCYRKSNPFPWVTNGYEAL